MGYWDNITEIYRKQSEKRLKEYGMTLEENTDIPVADRITILEEELVDALVYLEHLRSKVEV